MTNRRKRIAGFCAAVLVTLGSVMPAMAKTSVSYESVSGTSTSFTKYLVMNEEIKAPIVTFGYQVTAGAAQAASDGTTLEVSAGVTPENVTMKVGDTSLKKEDGIYSLKFSATDVVQSGDGNVIAAGKYYASKEITLDFSECSFSKPGVYRYLLKETGTNTAVTNDAKPVRIIDVYVENHTVTENDVTKYGLKVDRYVMYEGTENTNQDASVSVTPGDKKGYYENTYATKNLTLQKNVSGNQASRAEYFEFTVKIEGATPGTIYTVNLDNAEGSPKGLTGVTNEGTLIVGTDGKVEATYWLQGGQYIVIHGLAKGTGYTIYENDTTMDQEGYSTTITTSGKDTDAAITDQNNTASTTEGNKRQIADTDTGLTEDLTVIFDNNKNSVISTGIIMTVGPVAVVGAAVVLIVILLLVRGRRRAAEDEE